MKTLHSKFLLSICVVASVVATATMYVSNSEQKVVQSNKPLKPVGNSTELTGIHKREQQNNAIRGSEKELVEKLPTEAVSDSRNTDQVSDENNNHAHAEESHEEHSYSESDHELVFAKPPTEDMEIYDGFDRSVLPPEPSPENMNIQASGEYANQINQQAIFKKAVSEGIDVAKLEATPNTPTKINIAIKPSEHTDQVQQESINKIAKSKGIESEEVNSSANSPLTDNINEPPTGYNADQVGNDELYKTPELTNEENDIN